LNLPPSKIGISTGFHEKRIIPSADCRQRRKWAIYPFFGRGPKLINLETGREEADTENEERERIINRFGR